MTTLPVRVIKVGGSLFGLADLAERLDTWHRQQMPARDVWIAGGGKLVDELRNLDQRFGFEPAQTHAWSIEMMGISAQMLAVLIGRARVVDRVEAVLHHSDDPLVFDCRTWMSEHLALPVGWNVTSDSIAARLAAEIAAFEVVLLKSTRPERIDNPAQLVNQEVVDPCFPEQLTPRTRLRIVNLRERGFPEATWDAREAPVNDQGESFP